MTLTQQTIAELPLKERRQLGAEANYFLSKEYHASKRNKNIMTARQEIEHGTDRISSIQSNRGDLS